MQLCELTDLSLCFEMLSMLSTVVYIIGNILYLLQSIYLTVLIYLVIGSRTCYRRD
jgi:hypothetical protein